MGASLGEFEQLVLLAIMRLGDEAYGVTIRRAIQERTGRDVSAGAVYTTLSRLEKRGFVSSRMGETAPERTGQRRRYYRVEREGALLLQRSMRDIGLMGQGMAPAIGRLAEELPADGQGNGT